MVSTERPPEIAHNDAPAPRWQLTIRTALAATPKTDGARLATQACESPWKP